MRDISEGDDNEFDSGESAAFWSKESLFRIAAVPPGRPRWYFFICVFSVSVVLLLTFIISISITKVQVDRRFSAIELEIKNVSQSVESLISRILQLEKRGHEAIQVMNQMRLNLNSLQTQSDEFFIKLNNIEEVTAQLKCQINGFSNRTENQCCPLDWALYNSHCYYFSSEGKSWNAARDECERMKSELLIIKSKEEKTFVIKHTSPFFYWLGLSDERTGEWEWLDGTPYSMIKSEWMPGQPDNWMAHGLGGGEDCAHFHRDGRYNDDHCSRNYRYVCKTLANMLE